MWCLQCFYGFLRLLVQVLNASFAVGTIMTQCHNFHCYWVFRHQFCAHFINTATKWGVCHWYTHRPLALRNLCLLAAVQIMCFSSRKNFTHVEDKGNNENWPNFGKIKWLNLAESKAFVGGITQCLYQMKSKNYEKLDHTEHIVAYQTKWNHHCVYRQPSVDGYFYLLALSKSKKVNVNTKEWKKERIKMLNK